MTDNTRNDEADAANSTGAFALNAMTPDEREAFERELATSPASRDEVAGLADTATLLGNAIDPIDPPASLKASIMSQIAVTPQLPRLEPVAPVAEHRTPVRDAARAALATPTSTTPAGRAAADRWFTRPLVVAAGIAAAFGLVVGGIATAALLTPTSDTTAADTLAAINAADDMQQAVADVSGGGTATLVWSNELLTSALIVDGLEPLPESKVYELWYIGESGPRAAGTFSVDADGTTWRVLDGDMQASDVVAITVEPAGGSEQPTSDPIVAFESA